MSLNSTKVLMQILSIGESTLQGESNCLCSQKTRRRVDKDSVKGRVLPVYIPSMSSLEVSLDRREELEHWSVVVLWINLQIFRQEPVFKAVRMKRVTRGRTPGFQFFSFMDVSISSKGILPAPVIPESIVSTFEAGHELL